MRPPLPAVAPTSSAPAQQSSQAMGPVSAKMTTAIAEGCRHLKEKTTTTQPSPSPSTTAPAPRCQSVNLVPDAMTRAV